MKKDRRFSHSKVVVVEDDSTMLCLWNRILKDVGVTDCEYFSNPLEALSLLEKIPCQLLISDIVMPDAYGYELAKIASHRNPACQVILTTAYGTELSRFDLSDCRFHLLHKPYTDVTALKRFLVHLLNGDATCDDLASESSSENEDYPQITEWKL